ncbi:MAG: glucosaminidase domain-containing protein [Bacteriovorax sp.]
MLLLFIIVVLQVQASAKEDGGSCIRDIDGYPLGPDKVEFLNHLGNILKENSNQKKRAFLMEIVPLAVNANEKVEIEREFLAQMMAKKSSELTEEEKIKMKALHVKYKTDDIADEEKALKELKLRINVVPLDLILTQAALESGWGSTTIAKKCSNLFGIHDGNGLSTCSTPSGRIAQFGSVQESIEYHLLNLNRGDSYKEFREKRQDILDSKKVLTGIELAPTLIHYSTRKKAYTNELIKFNKSNKFSSSVHEALRLTELYEGPTDPPEPERKP